MEPVDTEKILNSMEKLAEALCPEFKSFTQRIYNIPSQHGSFRALKRVIASSILQETLGENANVGSYLTSMVAKESMFRFFVSPTPSTMDRLDIGRFSGALYFVTPPICEGIEVISFCTFPDDTVLITGTSLKSMRITEVTLKSTGGLVAIPDGSSGDNAHLVGTVLSAVSKVLAGRFTDQTFVKRVKKSGKEVWNPGVLENT
jgi:hypothetical protein